MANAINGNSVYVDTTGALDISKPQNVKVTGVILTATAASAQLVLQDNASTAVNKLDVRVATDESSQFFDFSMTPIVFPNGIKVSALTNALATIIFTRGANGR